MNGLYSIVKEEDIESYLLESEHRARLDHVIRYTGNTVSKQLKLTGT